MQLASLSATGPGVFAMDLHHKLNMILVLSTVSLALEQGKGSPMPGTMHSQESRIEIPDHFPTLGQSTADAFQEGDGLSGRRTEAIRKLIVDAPELKQRERPRSVPALALPPVLAYVLTLNAPS